VLDTKGSIGAVQTAMQSIHAATAVDVPWLRSGEALTAIRAHLDDAAAGFASAADIARSDAGGAASLLDEMATTVRGTSGRLDGRRGVDAVHDRAALLDPIADDVVDNLEFIGRQQGTDRMRELLGASYDDMSPDDWRALAELAARDEATRPAGLQFTKSSIADHLARVADNLEQGRPLNEKWGGWSILNKLRAEARYPTREDAIPRVREITRKAHADVTRQDLHDLDGIMQLPEARRPAPMNQWPISNAAHAAELRGSGAPINAKWWKNFDHVGDRYRWFDQPTALEGARSAVRDSVEEMTDGDWRTLAAIADLPSNSQALLVQRMRRGQRAFVVGHAPQVVQH
jgi:hypothetical protein